MPVKVRESGEFLCPFVYGGIEKFAKTLYDCIPGIIPIEITKKDRESRRTKSIIHRAVMEHNPDFAITNDIDNTCTVYLQNLGVPMISIIHEPKVRDIRYLDLGKRINKILDNNGHVYFVSQAQYEFHSDMCERINGFPIKEITGYINPAYCDDSSPVELEKLYDSVTIGRTDTSKNPFLLHQKMAGSDLTSLVLTSDSDAHSKEQQNYADKHSEWQEPQFTIRNLVHSDVMAQMKKSRVFVSTFPRESWGITALEALASGLPIILLSDGSKHSSQDIAADPSHVVVLPKSISKSDLWEAVRELSSISDVRRCEIAMKTRAKHSKTRYLTALDEMIQYRLLRTKVNSLDGFI